jgi:hypothetical protein
MPEHLIRLRGGWLWVDPYPGGEGGATGHLIGEGNDSGRRVTLPLTWPAATAGRVRLVRSFGPAPVDPGRETLILRLSQVGGLAAAWLNGREIARPIPGTTTLDIPLSEPLSRRNFLVLDVDLDPPGSGLDPEPWGAIALVIGPREVLPDARPG